MLVIVVGILREAKPQLPHVAGAGNLPGLLADFGEDRKQDGGDDGYDSDDDQEFDKRKTLDAEILGARLHYSLFFLDVRCLSDKSVQIVVDRTAEACYDVRAYEQALTRIEYTILCALIIDPALVYI